MHFVLRFPLHLEGPESRDEGVEANTSFSGGTNAGHLRPGLQADLDIVLYPRDATFKLTLPHVEVRKAPVPHLSARRTLEFEFWGNQYGRSSTFCWMSQTRQIRDAGRLSFCSCTVHLRCVHHSCCGHRGIHPSSGRGAGTGTSKMQYLALLQMRGC